MKKNLAVLFKNAVARRVAMNADLMEVKVSDELSYFISKLEVGGLVYDADSNLVKDIQFDFEGYTYVIGENGEITEINEIVVSEEAPMEFSDDAIESILEEVTEEIVVDYEAQISELNTKIAELEAKLAVYEKAEEANVEIPADPITTTFSKDIKIEPSKGVLGVLRNLK